MANDLLKMFLPPRHEALVQDQIRRWRHQEDQDDNSWRNLEVESGGTRSVRGATIEVDIKGLKGVMSKSEGFGGAG